ncbi:MAG: carboxymuconolactone decarboxylase family protein [Gemmatimonadetes bacterium]|nr:carboxymuconolactone decarboxylase family protein [Gemmatimonadota bacterium]
MTRVDYAHTAPGAYSAMIALERYVRQSGIEHSLLELVKVRASQINGCAFCLDMHAKDARAAGETEQRLHMLAAWREAPCYTPRERVALEWTEAVTTLGRHGVEQPLFEAAQATFGDRALVDLTMAIIAINGWNRLAIAFHSPEAGSYVVPKAPSAHDG